jgi:hypothetical protein
VLGSFQHFWLQTEFLSHQNMMTNTSGKVRQVKTSESEKVKQATTSFVEQRLLYTCEEDLGEFFEEMKIKDLIKNIQNLSDIQLIYTARKQKKKRLLMKKLNLKQLMNKK